MPHAPGWIDLYSLLESGAEPPPELVAQCRSNRTTGTEETMLHWYAIEGEPRVVQRLIELGFEVDVTCSSGATPIQHAATLRRWDMVRVLRDAGARRSGVDSCGFSYRLKVTEAGDDAPADLRGDAYQLEDLLLPGGPEDTPVLSLFITRAGLPDDTPGPAISQDAWIDFATGDPDIEVDLEDPVDSLATEADGAFAASLLLLDDYADVRGPGILVQPQGDLGLRAAYRIAKHFNARVVWSF